MKIEIVHLENIRSHVMSTVPFVRGFNCLVGGLGCGKSSILYAIDFALFGDPVGRSYDYLLRGEAEKGKVIVQFTQNGKSYKVSRGLRKRGKGIGQDPDLLELFENETLISNVKSDAVAEQLKAVTGLDKELFREIVWIKQEHLKELLDSTPRERQTRLDKLFGLSDYEEAWNGLAAFQREFEGERRAYERDPDVSGMEKLSSDYERAAGDFTLVEVELEALRNRLNGARKTLEEADLGFKKMEETRTETEEYKRRQIRFQADLRNIKNNAARLAKTIEEKKNSVEMMKQRLVAQGEQMASFFADLKEIGFEHGQPIDTMRKQLALLDDQIASVKGEKEATLRAMRENEKRALLSAENRCPLCLQQLTEEYKSGIVQRLKEENDRSRKIIDESVRKIEKLQQVRDKASNAFSNLQQLSLRTDDLRNHINEESKALNGLDQELAENRELETKTKAQLESVEAEIAKFDLSELEAARVRSKQALERFHQLSSELRVKEDHRRSLIERLDEIKERVDQAQHKVEDLARTVKLIEMVGSIRESYRNIQPKLRGEFVRVLRNFVQHVLDDLADGEGPLLNVVIDDTYTPSVKSEGHTEREVSNLSGGERTLLAFAYRLGLGQLIMQSRTGHGLSILLLDEPTESLGSEDGSIERLADAISRFKAVEQIIAVTHSDAFAEKAEHVIRLDKEAGESKVSIER